MSDLLASASTWLEEQRRAYLTRSVIFRRGAASNPSVEVTVGRNLFRVPDEFGIYHRIESRDYLVAAADLTLDGTAVEPQVRDQFVETLDGKTHVFEVMAPGGEPCFRWSDRSKTRYRIHTNLVSVT